MASESPPCHLQIIKTVWTSVEPFLDIQSTIRASQTCRSLHDELVDEETQKIKVSHFSSVPNRIPYYLPSALNAVHFPSLRSIHMTFLSMRSPGEGVEDIGDSVSSSFPIFVAHLACARNLERLYVNMTRVLMDDSRRFEPLIPIFGRNLARCKTLRELRLYGQDEYSYCPNLMKDTLLALTPVLRRQKNVLRKFGFGIESRPAPNPTPSTTLHSAATDFFEAVLACTSLKGLNITLTHSIPLTNSFLEAVKEICLSKSYSPVDHCLSMKHLDVNLTRGANQLGFVGWDQDQYLKSAQMLFDHFSHCEQLRDVHLGLPREIWGAHIGTVAKMLCGKPQLLIFSFIFCGYADDDGKVMDLLENCGVERDNEKRKDLLVQKVKNVDGQRLYRLMDSICPNGKRVELRGFASVDPGEGEGADEGGSRRQEVGPSTLQEDMPERVDVKSLSMSNVRRRDIQLWLEEG